MRLNLSLIPILLLFGVVSLGGIQLTELKVTQQEILNETVEILEEPTPSVIYLTDIVPHHHAWKIVKDENGTELSEGLAKYMQFRPEQITETTWRFCSQLNSTTIQLHSETGDA